MSDGRRGALTPARLVSFAVLVLLVVGAVVVARGDGEDGTTWAADHGLGEVARLEGGAVARVNRLTRDVTLPPGAPAPEPDRTLVRVDAELCAGEEDLFVDSAFWLGLGDDRAVHSPHMGVRELVTMTLAPGGCQRGDVDLALPTDVELVGVLLVDHTRTTVASWSVDGAPAGSEPLHSGRQPEAAAVGSEASLRTTGTATVHEVVPGAAPVEGGPQPDSDQTLVRIDGEVCAEHESLLTGPRDWFVQLSDHRLVRAQADGSSIEQGELEAGACVRGTADFLVPRDGRVVAVAYTHGGVYEEARWDVGS